MSNDHKLKNDVLAELAWEPSVSADHIGVTAENGVVTLTGHVHHYRQKAAAERAVGRVKGVKAIVEGIEVKLDVRIHHTDKDMSAAATQALSWNALVPRGSVKVWVQKGFATLTGEVQSRYQYDEAALTVSHLNGVIGMANQVQVRQRPNTLNIHSDISQALHRSWVANDHVTGIVSLNCDGVISCKHSCH